MKKARFFLLDKSGEMFVDLLISLIVIFLIVATFLYVFPVFTAQQALNTEARTLISVAESEGGVDNAVTDAQHMIELQSGWAADSISWDAVWLREGDKTVQLNDPITVTLTKNVPIPVLISSDGKYLINVTVKATAIGASEVYFKP